MGVTTKTDLLHEVPVTYHGDMYTLCNPGAALQLKQSNPGATLQQCNPVQQCRPAASLHLCSPAVVQPCSNPAAVTPEPCSNPTVTLQQTQVVFRKLIQAASRQGHVHCCMFRSSWSCMPCLPEFFWTHHGVDGGEQNRVFDRGKRRQCRILDGASYQLHLVVTGSGYIYKALCGYGTGGMSATPWHDNVCSNMAVM